MRKIDRIIRESIDKVITEGYSGKYAEDWMNKELIPKIGRWLKSVKTNKPNVDRTFFTSVYTNGYAFDKRYTMMMRGRNTYSVVIKLCYFPDKIFDYGVGGITYTPKSLDDKNIEVILNVNKDAELPFIYRALTHEFTHVIDFITSRKKGKDSYFGYQHQMELGYEIPSCIMKVMYLLWDNSEFNAWQTNVNNNTDLFNEHFEEIMNCLNKANEINDERTWNNVRKYLADKVKQSLSNKTSMWIKKYFIDTSFKLLKKFTKKVSV